LDTFALDRARGVIEYFTLASGVAATFEEWPQMVHVWHLFADRLADGRKALVRVGEFVRAHIGR